MTHSPLKPKHTIELFDLPPDHPSGKTVGYRTVSADLRLDIVLETDVDFLVQQLTEILAHIGQVVPDDSLQALGDYPWPC